MLSVAQISQEIRCHYGPDRRLLKARSGNTRHLVAVARKAIERKTGARGLRSILESILLETMFDLPGLEGVEEVVISREVVEGTARPLYIYADRATVETSASA